MQAHLPLGNDIVDLSTTHNKNSAADPRYVSRVLARQELDTLAQSTNPHATFWAWWAAKEAAYKAFKKNDPELVFAHSRFVVETAKPLAIGATPCTGSGTVQHAHQRIAVTWSWTADWVHCVTTSASHSPLCRVNALTGLRDRDVFDRMKKSGPLSDESVAARILALDLLREQGMRDVQIVRPMARGRPGPPQILDQGVLLPHPELSLSHDGRFAAAAVSKV